MHGLLETEALDLADPRVSELAKVLVHTSVKVQPGERVMVRADVGARPLIEEVFREIARAGGFPLLMAKWEELSRIVLLESTEEQLATPPVLDEYLFKNVAAVIVLDAPENTRALTTVDGQRRQLVAKARKPITEYAMAGGVRWVGCNYPTHALAQDADMSLSEYEDFLYSACLVDWEAARRDMARIKAAFDAGNQVRIVAPGTDLTFSIAGRPGVIASGEYNMPDGEVFYAPLEKTVEGHITYTFPAIYSGTEVAGVRLEFQGGKAVQATANKGEAFLNATLDTDSGARYLGEFGIGCNFGIQRFSRDILFDEKIGGTIHLALGAALPECQGTNDSAVHWDMICDLRQGGKLYLDGKLVQENGKWLF